MARGLLMPAFLRYVTWRLLRFVNLRFGLKLRWHVTSVIFNLLGRSGDAKVMLVKSAPFNNKFRNPLGQEWCRAERNYPAGRRAFVLKLL